MCDACGHHVVEFLAVCVVSSVLWGLVAMLHISFHSLLAVLISLFSSQYCYSIRLGTYEECRLSGLRF